MVAKRAARPKPSAEDALYEIIRHVRPLHRYLAKAVADRLAGTGITIGMRAMLERLNDGGPQTVPQVARSLAIKRQFIQRVVNTALELGLVASVPNPAHLRSSLIALTPRGRSAFERIRAVEQTTLEAIAKELPRRDIDACLRVTSLLTERFRAITNDEGLDE